jgi:hypothetical protein
MTTDQSAQPIVGLQLRADGTVRPLTSRADIDTAIEALDSVPGTAGARGWDADGYRLVMLVDDIGVQRNLPLNLAATELYGTGWPIVGDAVLIDDDLRPLPADVVGRYHRELSPVGPNIGWNFAEPAAQPVALEPVALEWEDHLDYLDKDQYRDPAETDVDLEPGDEWLLDPPRALDDGPDVSW